MQYRRKTPAVRAVQITSQDINDLPEWVQEADRSGEIFVEYPPVAPCALDHIPFDDPWVIGKWIVSIDGPSEFDAELMTAEDFSNEYEEASA